MESSIESLIQDLKHEDIEVRKNAAWGLGEHGDKRAVEPLIEALKDSDWRTRRAAANSLGKIKDVRAV